jgi:hypothetical protein
MGRGLARMDRQGFWVGRAVIAASTHIGYGLQESSGLSERSLQDPASALKARTNTRRSESVGSNIKSQSKTHVQPQEKWQIA